MSSSASASKSSKVSLIGEQGATKNMRKITFLYLDNTNLLIDYDYHLVNALEIVFKTINLVIFTNLH